LCYNKCRDNNVLFIFMAGKLKNAKHEKFCKLFASDEEYFCNGTQSYLKVYSTPKKPIKYETARANACKLLTNADILQRIDELLEQAVLNDEFVDKQLGKLIAQDADFKAKVAAIKEYNQLKQRVKKRIDKIDDEGVHTTEYENLTDQDLDGEIEKRQNRISQIT